MSMDVKIICQINERPILNHGTAVQKKNHCPIEPYGAMTYYI